MSWKPSTLLFRAVHTWTFLSHHIPSLSTFLAQLPLSGTCANYPNSSTGLHRVKLLTVPPQRNTAQPSVKIMGPIRFSYDVLQNRLVLLIQCERLSMYPTDASREWSYAYRSWCGAYPSERWVLKTSTMYLLPLLQSAASNDLDVFHWASIKLPCRLTTCQGFVGHLMLYIAVLVSRLVEVYPPVWTLTCYILIRARDDWAYLLPIY